MASLLLGRMSGLMLAVGLVLVVLERYRSPQLAGAAVFLFTFPGLLASPLAGAQHRTDPTRRGRAFAVSMSLNVAGSPIGSVLVG